MNTFAPHADAAQRRSVYRGLERRNRIVGVMRLAVPALGLVALLALVSQILLTSIGSRFSMGPIRVAPDAVTIEAPEYAGRLEDGSTYRVWAGSAQNNFATPDLIDLVDAQLHVDRPNGTTLSVSAPQAQLETMEELVIVEGIAHVEDSTGTRGTLHDSVFDWAEQVLVSEGPVTMTYADGTELEAEGLTFDTNTAIWTFSGAKVTLQDTPGAQQTP